MDGSKKNLEEVIKRFAIIQAHWSKKTDIIVSVLEIQMAIEMFQGLLEMITF